MLRIDLQGQQEQIDLWIFDLPGKENLMSSEELRVHVEDLYSQLEEQDMTLTVGGSWIACSGFGI